MLIAPAIPAVISAVPTCIICIDLGKYWDHALIPSTIYIITKSSWQACARRLKKITLPVLKKNSLETEQFTLRLSSVWALYAKIFRFTLTNLSNIKVIEKVTHVY